MASLYIAFTIPLILFVIFHLADLTWGSANPEFVRGEPYHNMVESFSRVPVAAASSGF